MTIQNGLGKVKRGSREAVEYCSLQVFTDKLHQHITNSLNILELALLDEIEDREGIILQILWFSSKHNFLPLMSVRTKNKSCKNRYITFIYYMGSDLSANTDFDLQIRFLKRDYALVGNPF